MTFLVQMLEVVKKNKALTVVSLAACVYGLFFSIVSWMRYDAFSYSDFDLAIFVHECWKILHGSANISILNDTPIWGNAMELISYVNALFFYLGGGHPKSLLVMQSFILGLTAVPIYLIARRKLDERFAACLAISYLFYSPIWYANLYEYNPLVYTTFTLAVSFYFLVTSRFVLFMTAVILTLMNRADLSIVTLMFGVYAWRSGKSWRWVLTPLLLSVVWLYIALLVVIPHFKQGINFDSYYSHYGSGFGNIIKNILINPSIILKDIFTQENLFYIFQIMSPVLFFPFLALHEFLICVLSLMQHLLSSRPQEHTILFHYTSTVTPFVYIAAAYGAARIFGKRPVSVFICALPIILSIVSNCIYGPIKHYQYYQAQTRSDDEDVYKSSLVRDIPSSAVTSSFEFSSALAGRMEYYSFHYIYSGFLWPNVAYKTPEHIDYALINFYDPRLRSFNEQGSDLRMRSFFEDAGFGVKDMVNNVVLFKRQDKGAYKLFEIIPGQPAMSIDQSLDPHKDHAALLQVTSNKTTQRQMSVLQLAFQWRAINRINRDIYAAILIINEQGKKVYSLRRQLCYGVYPSSRWRPDELVIDHLNLLIPFYLPHGKYKVCMLFLNENTDLHSGLPLLKYYSEDGKVNQLSVISEFEL